VQPSAPESVRTFSPARFIDAKDLGDGDPARTVTDHVMAHHTDLWALKLSDWDSEYEYRFVGSSAVSFFLSWVSESQPAGYPLPRRNDFL
jgi:hypothetical protein